MEKLVRAVEIGTGYLNAVAAGSLVALMFLGVAEVVTRFFGKSLGGSLEISGFLGVLVTSLALAHTAVAKGHVAVTFLVQKMSLSRQVALEGATALVGSVVFFAIAIRGFIYCSDIITANEVSMTLGMPVYPFALGFAVGVLLLAFVLLAQFLQALWRSLRI